MQEDRNVGLAMRRQAESHVAVAIPTHLATRIGAMTLLLATLACCQGPQECQSTAGAIHIFLDPQHADAAVSVSGNCSAAECAEPTEDGCIHWVSQVDATLETACDVSVAGAGGYADEKHVNVADVAPCGSIDADFRS